MRQAGLSSKRPVRQRGATLTLVIMVIFVIVLAGMAFFFLSQILSGSRQTSFAVDAGALNTAKQALKEPTVNAVTLGIAQFAGLGEGGSDEINLMSYNRAVAVSLLIMMNGDEEKTPQAQDSVQKAVKDLEKLGSALANQLNSGYQLNFAFDRLVDSNKANMVGKGKVSREGNIFSAYMKPGGSTNVVFNPASVVGVSGLNSYLNLQAGAKKNANGLAYMKGYAPLTAAGQSIYGVPVFPGQSPHLVSTTDFQNSRTLPGAEAQIASIPPNAFQGKGQTLVQKANQSISATASAIVGCLSRDFEASIPMGYVKIRNSPSATLPTEWTSCSSDGSNDLFNKELFAPSKIVQADNGVFTTDKNQMQLWVAHNATSGDDYDKDGSSCPARNGSDVSAMRMGGGTGQRATIEELHKINAIKCECTHTMYDGTAPGDCTAKANLDKWASNYGRFSKYLPLDGKRDGYTAVEYMKVSVLYNRVNAPRTQTAIVSPPPVPTGMMLFDHNGTYRAPPLKFSKIGTPWQLMQQVGDCATNTSGSAFARLLKRCNQIKPGTSADDLIALLNSKPIPMGTTFYLYSPSSGAKLTMDETGPRQKPPMNADGERDSVLCSVKYEINNKSVNTVGDADFTQDAPFSACNALKQPIYHGIDRVVWTPSTGYQNNLGIIEFENYATSEAEFGMPN